jgi:hypothetical protein
MALGLILSACGSAPNASASNASPEPRAVEDQASLVAALKVAGATIETGDPISQPFFSVEGNILKVNGQMFSFLSMKAQKRWSLNRPK